jgi:hypothetical protein
LDILKLQSQVLAMGNAKIPVIGGEKIWEGIADSIASLNTFKYFKMHIFSLLGAVIIIAYLCFVFCIVCQAGWRRITAQE